ncbi:MAG: class I SAM-dependent methyltransferase [Planctomycetaceae bacterium]
MLIRTLEPEVMDTADEAAEYDAMDHSVVNRVFVDDLLSFSQRHNVRGTVLDLGTGTALIPLVLVGQSRDLSPVLACDLSFEMLKLARHHISRQQLSDSILPVFSDCKRLPVAEASCDVVMSNSIIHHIPEPLDVFREIRRVIRPGGLVFVRDLMRPQSNDDVESLVQMYAGNESTVQKQLFRQSLHAALTVEEVDRLAAQAGLPQGCVAATSDRHWTLACVACSSQGGSQDDSAHHGGA